MINNCIGKISEQEVEKIFKEKLAKKIKDDEDELVLIEERRVAIYQELNFLSEETALFSADNVTVNKNFQFVK